MYKRQDKGWGKQKDAEKVSADFGGAFYGRGGDFLTEEKTVLSKRFFVTNGESFGKSLKRLYTKEKNRKNIAMTRHGAWV